MKEEDKWIKELRNHMEDYSEPLPEHGWEDLEKALSASRVIPMWRTPRFIAAAAVFVAAVSSLSIWLTKMTSEDFQQSNYADAIEKIQNDLSENGGRLEDGSQPEDPALAQQIHPVGDRGALRPTDRMAGLLLQKSGTEGRSTASSNEEDQSRNLQEISLPDSLQAIATRVAAADMPEGEEAATQRKVQQRDLDRRRMAQNRASMEMERQHKDKKEKGWSVELMAGNTPYSASNSFGGFSGLPARTLSSANGTTLIPASDEYAAYKQVLFNNRDGQAVTTANHKMPVTVGASFRWSFSKNWAVETGLTYTYLSSTFRSGADSYWEKEQNLHYVGIPLKIHRMLWNSRWVSVYASAGGMMEKCVSGSEDIRFVRGVVEGEPEHNSLQVDPLQWSLMASAGVQLNITRHLGLYAEPGVAYYFDDKSGVETIRKEHPCNFNLQVGLRLEFGK